MAEGRADGFARGGSMSARRWCCPESAFRRSSSLRPRRARRPARRSSSCLARAPVDQVSAGAVLVVGGAPGFAGAPVLAARRRCALGRGSPGWRSPAESSALATARHRADGPRAPRGAGAPRTGRGGRARPRAWAATEESVALAQRVVPPPARPAGDRRRRAVGDGRRARAACPGAGFRRC